MLPLLAVFAGSIHAQTLEGVTLYRDAAVVTWTAGSPQGSSALARSLSPLSMDRVTAYPANADQAIGAMSNVEFPWSNPDGDALQRAEERLEVLRLDVALKEAQLALVEEDLAVLRANRSIGGTSESLLVEDLEEMADWMHDAFREMLYRRVELREELAAWSASATRWKPPSVGRTHGGLRVVGPHAARSGRTGPDAGGGDERGRVGPSRHPGAVRRWAVVGSAPAHPVSSVPSGHR